MCWLSDYFSRFVNIFLCYFFSKAVFKRLRSIEKPYKNISKWETKSSWKGNVRKYLFILPIFSPGAGSNVYKRNIFATIRLWLFSANIDEIEVCTKKFDQLFKKLTCSSSYIIKKWALFVWLINYLAIGIFCMTKLLCIRKTSLKTKFMKTLKRKSILMCIFSKVDT